MTRYRISRFVTRLAGDGAVALSHGPSMQRLTVTHDLADALELFREGASLDDLADACDDASAAARVVELFSRHALLVPEDLDEDRIWAERLGLATAPRAPFTRETGALPFDKAAPLALADVTANLAASDTAAPSPLRIALIGGCFLQVLADFVKHAALRRGYLADVAYHWPDGADHVRRTAKAPSDLAILHPFVRPLLEPLWGAYGGRADDLDARLDVLITGVEAYVRAFADGLDGRLGLVHNLTAPQCSPRGRHDYTAFQQVHRINDALAAVCAPHPNLVLVNEEAIASTIGKWRVLDDLHHAYSHHGHGYTSQDEIAPWVDVERAAAFCTALADHQLEAHDAWRGKHRIKCVVTDLDDTLWPGVIGDGGIDFDRLKYFEGIHEALALLKARGIILATCSKNDEPTVLAAWRQFATPPFLRPEDFVLHRINWRRKSDNLAELAARLGLGLDAILFLDDSAVERAEVRHALPAVTVWDGPVHDLRSYLLTHPRLDRLVATDESVRRTELVQAQLRRDDLRIAARSELDFLRGLEICLTVARATPRDAARLTELFHRTNQFHTSLIRYPPSDVAVRIERGEVWCLAVRDRFTDHGLVGAIVLVPGEPGAPAVETMVLSCRVIGLAVAVPFLATSLRAAGLDAARPRGTIVLGPRNHPARAVFADAGFTAEADGSYLLRHPDDLAPIDPSIHRIACPPRTSDDPTAPHATRSHTSVDPTAPHATRSHTSVAPTAPHATHSHTAAAATAPAGEVA